MRWLLKMLRMQWSGCLSLRHALHLLMACGAFLSLCTVGSQANAQLDGASVDMPTYQQIYNPRNGSLTIYDHRVYNWPAFGRVKFVERDIARNINRRRGELRVRDTDDDDDDDDTNPKRGLFSRFRNSRRRNSK